MIWEQESDTPSNWQILPSGFVELIFNLGPAMENVQGKRVGGAFNPTEEFCFLSGIHTQPLYMSFPRFKIMGVQMHPLAVKAVFGLPCKEVRDWALIRTNGLYHPSGGYGMVDCCECGTAPTQRNFIMKK